MNKLILLALLCVSLPSASDDVIPPDANSVLLNSIMNPVNTSNLVERFARSRARGEAEESRRQATKATADLLRSMYGDAIGDLAAVDPEKALELIRVLKIKPIERASKRPSDEQ